MSEMSIRVEISHPGANYSVVAPSVEVFALDRLDNGDGNLLQNVAVQAGAHFGQNAAHAPTDNGAARARGKHCRRNRFRETNWLDSRIELDTQKFK